MPQLPYDPHFIELATRYSKDDLHPEMIEPADVVIVMHEPSFLINNWSKLKHKRVIWRSIGQSVHRVESQLAPLRREGLQVVRYSPEERAIPGYIGEDACIRFGKDPTEYAGWNGQDETVVNFTQSMAQRGSHCGWDIFKQVTEGLPVGLYGPGNDGISFWKGLVSDQEQKRVLRDSRAYFYTGTHPASYTLGFIEAWMTGIPMVAVGPHHGHPHQSGYPQNTYEVHNLIEQRVSGLWSDDVNLLRRYLRDLLNDYDLAKEIGSLGREKAIELFSTDVIGKQWAQFLR